MCNRWNNSQPSIIQPNNCHPNSIADWIPIRWTYCISYDHSDPTSYANPNPESHAVSESISDSIPHTLSDRVAYTVVSSCDVPQMPILPILP